MTNEALFERAGKVLVGGVNSPVRAWGAVGGTPRFFVRGEGAFLEDVEGKRYADYVCSWGPLILGHGHPEVTRAVTRVAGDSLSFGAPSPLEVDLAEMIRDVFPSMEKVRFVTSGTEATMTALRIARGVTGRSLVVKFAGCYHGHHDAMLVAAGSGALTLGHPNSPGIPEAVASCTVVLPYNDEKAVEEVFRKFGGDIAAVLVEPWAGNMSLVPPLPGFLGKLSSETRLHGALLIFDEVITGFRPAEGGVQQKEGIVPDLTCLGKIIGGGLPVGAVGGSAEIMKNLSPMGPVYQAGTLAGNPVAMSAGIATLKVLARPETYPALEEKANFFQHGMCEAARKAGFRFSMTRLGSIMGMFFSENIPRDLNEVKATRSDLYPRFFHGMRKRGFLFAPSPFESLFVSLAHDRETLASTLVAAEDVFAELAREED